MAKIGLCNPEAFALAFIGTYLEQGFQTLSKKDVDLLVFALLEHDGAVPRSLSNFDAGRALCLTSTRVKALRRDAAARWRPLFGDPGRKITLQRILSEVLTESNLKSAVKHSAEKTKADGFLAIRIEHADDKEEFEQALLDAGGIPVYERNRDVIAVRFDTLLTMSERYGFISANPGKIRQQLKDVAPTSEAVEAILMKRLADLTWDDARDAINVVGASVVKGMAEAKMSSLLRIVFPFLPG